MVIAINLRNIVKANDNSAHLYFQSSKKEPQRAGFHQEFQEIIWFNSLKPGSIWFTIRFWIYTVYTFICIEIQ